MQEVLQKNEEDTLPTNYVKIVRSSNEAQVKDERERVRNCRKLF